MITDLLQETVLTNQDTQTDHNHLLIDTIENEVTLGHHIVVTNTTVTDHRLTHANTTATDTRETLALQTLGETLFAGIVTNPDM